MNNLKPLCKDAWAIPPSPRMLGHGNDYHTCSKCGEPCGSIDLILTQTLEPCQRIYLNDGAYTARIIDSIACCPSCRQPIKEHKYG